MQFEPSEAADKLGHIDREDARKLRQAAGLGKAIISTPIVVTHGVVICLFTLFRPSV